MNGNTFVSTTSKFLHQVSKVFYQVFKVHYTIPLILMLNKSLWKVNDNKDLHRQLYYISDRPTNIFLHQGSTQTADQMQYPSGG